MNVRNFFYSIPYRLIFQIRYAIILPMDQDKLASQLTILPLWVVNKVELWLTYKGLKPVSLFSPRKKDGLTAAQFNKIKKWITNAGLFIEPDPHSGDEEHFIISQNTKLLDKVKKMDFSSHALPENYHKLGVLLGYPSEATKAYAYGSSSKLIGADDTGSPVRNKPESSYAQFLLRKGYEKEDIKTAKIWMNTVRHDIPKIAKEFEKEIKSSKKKPRQ